MREGARMNEKDLMHGVNWSGENLSGWIVSEKLDGVRVVWDGNQLWTRGGNVVKCPAGFTDGLPSNVKLDCELWAGRGQFQKARVAAQYGKWSDGVKLAIFDALLDAKFSYEERLEYARICSRFCADAFAVQTIRADSTKHALIMLDNILFWGGEGIIARRNDVPYSAGRSRSILKLFAREQAAPIS